MSDKYKEWLKQADYDMDTADVMYSSGRYFYAVFMCHLSIEKALKGLYYKVLGEVPPKTHNLLYLLNKIGNLSGRKVGPCRKPQMPLTDAEMDELKEALKPLGI